MSNNNVNIQRNQAYSTVMGIPMTEVIKPEHQKIMETAIHDVMKFSALYDGETYEARKQRINKNVNSPKQLKDYFSKLYPDKFKGRNAWEVTFEMLNELNDLNSKQADTSGNTTAGEVTEESKNDSLQIDTKSINNIKEGPEMANTNLSALQKMQENLSEGKDVNSTEVRPDASPELAQATAQAQKRINDEMVERLAVSRNAKVLQFVVAGPSKTEVLVDGADAQGTIDPEKVDSYLKKFNDVFGTEVQADGSVVFKNAVDQDEALAVYQALQAAKQDPEKKFPVYVNKDAAPSIKGVKISTDGKEAGVFMKWDDFINFIIEKSAGQISMPNNQIIEVKKNTRAASTGKEKKGSSTSKKGAYTGVASLKIQDRKNNVEAFKELFKELTETVGFASGFKSVVKASYYTGEKTEKNVPKKRTYRIPLLVNQHKLEVLDELKIKVFGDGKGIGAPFVPKSLDNEEDLKELLGALANIAGISIAKGASSEFIEGIRADMKTSENAAKAGEAAELEGLGL